MDALITSGNINDDANLATDEHTNAAGIKMMPTNRTTHTNAASIEDDANAAMVCASFVALVSSFDVNDNVNVSDETGWGPSTVAFVRGRTTVVKMKGGGVRSKCFKLKFEPKTTCLSGGLATRLWESKDTRAAPLQRCSTTMY